MSSGDIRDYLEPGARALALALVLCAGCSNFDASGNYYGFFWVARTSDSRVVISKTTGIITAEPNVSTTVSVVLNSIPDDDVTLTGIVSSKTSEVTVSPSTLTFTRGNFAVPQLLTLTGVDDFVSDGPQTFEIQFGPIESRDTFYANYKIPSLTGTNSDEDSAGITVTPTSGLVVTEAATTTTFSVTLNSEPVADVTIPLSVDDTTEASIDKTLLTFTALNWSVPQIVTVTGVNDDIDDGNKAFVVAVQPATSADPVYQGRDGTDVSGTNNDDDTIGFTVTANGCGLFTYEEAGAPDTFTFRLNSEPLVNVEISPVSSNTQEATVAPALLTFTPANWNTAQTVTVTGVDGFNGATDQAYTISFGNANSPGDALYHGVAVGSPVSGINLHNDAPGIAVRSTCQDTTTSEAGATASFYMTLRTNPAGSVDVTAVSSNTLEGTAAGTYTFTAANWFVRQLVTVTGVDDFIDDGNQAYSISFTGVGPVPYNGVLAGSFGPITNADNDTKGLTITPITAMVTTEAGGTAQFSVRLNSEPTAGVTVVLASNDATEGVVTSGGTLNFVAACPGVGCWSTPQTVTVTGQPDDLDGNGSTVGYAITVDLSGSADALYAGHVQPNIAMTNNDDP